MNERLGRNLAPTGLLAGHRRPRNTQVCGKVALGQATREARRTDRCANSAINARRAVDHAASAGS
jgi:hypothetical protein